MLPQFFPLQSMKSYEKAHMKHMVLRLAFHEYRLQDKLSFSGEKMPEYAKISNITPAKIILIIR